MGFFLILATIIMLIILVLLLAICVFPCHSPLGFLLWPLVSLLFKGGQQIFNMCNDMTGALRASKKTTSHGNEVLLQGTMYIIQRPCYQKGSPYQDPAGNLTT